MRLVAAIVMAVLMGGLFSQSALADKRVALMIGNSHYQNVSRLANPANDASLLAETFKKANFDVVMSRNDLSATEMRRVLREFADKAHSADIAVVYYAGHGIEVDGNNYLIPTDAVLERDTDVYDEALGLERVLIAVEPAKRLRLVIVDACRDNPFAKSMKRTVAMRAIGQGLAKVEPANPNTMIAFAAKAGFTAYDGDQGQTNSPYATALAAHLTTPGLDLRKVFGFVRDDVMKATNNKQEPFIYGSLGGDDMALVPPPAAVAHPAPPQATDPNEAIRRDYELAERVGTREAWDFFIATYPNGFYSKLAQAQRNKLAADEARAAATEKAKAAAEEKARRDAEQVKAAAEAKAAEDARVAAEKKKAIEEAKLAEAERAKAAAQAKASEEARLAAERKAEQATHAADEARAAAEKAAQERIAKAEEEAKAAAAKAKAAADARAAEEARVAALKKALDEAKAAEAERAKTAAAIHAADGKSGGEQPPGKLASLTPAEKPADAQSAGVDTPRLLLSELRRVGCFTGSIDGSWGESAQRAVGLFNKHAGTRLDTKVASLDTLGVVKGKNERVCPLICERGYKADGETCTRIICKAGFELNADDECEKVKSRKPEAKQETRPEDSRPSADRPTAYAPGSDAEFLHRCGATSCSAARNGCMRKAAILGADPSMCDAKYQGCLRTGSFVGRFCNLHGLARN